MFDLVNGKWLDAKGELYQLITEFGETPNADIQYYEGVGDANGKFTILGVNKLHLQDKVAVLDGAGVEVEPKDTSYTDFKGAFNASPTEATLLSTLEKRGIKKMISGKKISNG